MVYKAITAADNSAPLRLTVPGHELIDGWPFTVMSVKGMTQINARSALPTAAEHYPAVVVDNNTLEVNEVNAIDYGIYTGGGVIRYWTIPDLGGFQAHFEVTDKRTKASLFTLSTVGAPATQGSIEVDVITSSVKVTFSDEQSEALNFKKADYVLTLESPTGVVDGLLYGTLAT